MMTVLRLDVCDEHRSMQLEAIAAAAVQRWGIRPVVALRLKLERRNVADIPRALAELARVLRPGASLAVLDFNNSDQPLVDGFQARARSTGRQGIAAPCLRSCCAYGSVVDVM